MGTLPRWRLLVGPLTGLAAGGLVLLFAGRRLPGGAGGGLAGSLTSVVWPAWLAAAVLCLLVLFVADAASLVIVSRALKPGISIGGSLRVALESRLLEGATSFGGLELPYQVMRLRGLGMSGTDASSAVAVKGLVHASVLVVLAGVVLAVGLGASLGGPARLVIVGCVAGLASVWMIIWRSVAREPSASAEGDARGLHKASGRSAALRRRIQEMQESLRTLAAGGWGPALGLILLQCLVWGASFSLAPLLLLSLGWRGPLLPVVLGQTFLPFVSAVSPLPGGAGAAELGYLRFVGTALPAELAVTSLVLWRTATWIVPMLVGAAAMALGSPTTSLAKRLATREREHAAPVASPRVAQTG